MQTLQKQRKTIFLIKRKSVFRNPTNNVKFKSLKRFSVWYTYLRVGCCRHSRNESVEPSNIVRPRQAISHVFHYRKSSNVFSVANSLSERSDFCQKTFKFNCCFLVFICNVTIGGRSTFLCQFSEKQEVERKCFLKYCRRSFRLTVRVFSRSCFATTSWRPSRRVYIVSSCHLYFLFA